MNTTKQQIEKEMKELYLAMKSKLLSVNDYCTIHHCLAKKLKQVGRSDIENYMYNIIITYIVEYIIDVLVTCGL